MNKVTPGPLNTPLVTSQRSDAFFTAASARYRDGEHAAKSTVSYSEMHSDYIDFGATMSHSQKAFASQNYTLPLSSKLASLTTLDVHHNLYSASFVGGEIQHGPEIAQTFIYCPQHAFQWNPLRYLALSEWISHITAPYKLSSTRC